MTAQENDGMDWNFNLNECPYGEVVEVTNKAMDDGTRTLLATRGWVRDDGIVHEDQMFFSTIRQMHGKYDIITAGQLCCPDRWRKTSNKEKPDDER